MRASVGPLTFFLMCLLAAGVVLADSPGLPVSLANGGKTTAQLDGEYLRLDASNDPLTGALSLANGGVGNPSLTWVVGGINTGFYATTAGALSWGSGGAAELSLTASGIIPAVTSGLSLGTSTLPFLSLDVATGTAALPALRMGDSNSGFFGGADVVNASVNGIQELVIGPNQMTPFAASGLALGTTSLPFTSLDVAAGTLASPGVRMGDANSGIVGGADTVQIAAGGANVLILGNGTATGLQYVNAANDVTGSGGVVRSLHFPSRSVGPTIMLAPTCTSALLGAELTLDDTDDFKVGVECKCVLGNDNVTYVWIYRRLLQLNGNGWEGTGCAP
jgi:hypothetical protein